MNVLSLFDGMSCGRIALERAGIKVDKYFSSEIDKYAIKITQKNYPDTIQLWDITELKGSDVPKIDLLIGGSPCQGFSLAGKQLNFNDPRSKLFFEFVRLLQECKPKYFLLENVRMKKEYQDIISKYLGVEPIKINSSLVSAQNRVRLYWSNIPNITQPKDKHIYLKDIIEYGIVNRDKAYCIDANYHKGGNLKQYFEKSRRQLVFGFAIRGRYNEEKKIIQKLECNKTEKENCLSTVQKDSMIGIFDIYCGDKKVEFSETFLKGKFKDWLLEKGINKFFTKQYEIDVTCKEDKRRANLYRLNHIRGINDKARCLTTSGSGIQNASGCGIMVEGCYRKLTVKECERLQTVPDNFTEGVSNSQRYKMLGNGWTVSVVSHIFSSIPKEDRP